MAQDVFFELTRKVFMESSKILPEIWKMICSEEEAHILNAMPAKASELAQKFGKSDEEMKAILDSLFKRGVVFEIEKEGQTVYRMPKHIVQFHDASLLWKDAPQAFDSKWEEFMEDEFTVLLKALENTDFPAFMRVIPINETIEAKSEVLIHEDAVKLIENATNLAVVDCVCRKSVRKCGRLLNACLQLNRGADYAIKRGTGRKLTREQAIAILKKTEEEGLVHMVENRVTGNVICNCCGCCCEMLRFFRRGGGGNKTLSPSRYLARIGDECNSCGSCIEICQVDAITIGDETAIVAGENCIGCGLCATVCPVSAIILEKVRSETHIPG